MADSGKNMDGIPRAPGQPSASDWTGIPRRPGEGLGEAKAAWANFNKRTETKHGKMMKPPAGYKKSKGESNDNIRL